MASGKVARGILNPDDISWVRSRDVHVGYFDYAVFWLQKTADNFPRF